MPIGAILLFAAATLYAKHKGVPFGDALQELNPCVACYKTTDTVVDDDSAQDLPANYSDLRLSLSHSHRRSSSSSNGDNSTRSVDEDSCRCSTAVSSGGTVRVR